MILSLRDEEPGDEGFVRRLVIETVADELGADAWPEPLRSQLLEMQFASRRDAIRELVCRYPDRFLFGTDLVTRHGLPPEHYTSRYWCQRTLWESTWEGPSPIADPDYTPPEHGPATPLLRGVGLPQDVLKKVYYENAVRLLKESSPRIEHG